ncbi:MAG TPA: FAD-binding oxidoreductase [Ktedonobacteraceae bacterium]|jgi:FAD/FMN-containing dehydrogenase
MQTLSTLTRRAFLRLSGLGLTGLLAACEGATAHTPVPTPGVTLTVAGPTEADWSKLAVRLLRPQDAGYPAAHRLFSTRFDDILPQGVAYCATPEDVQACLGFARRFQLPLALRSGGHSYAGYSTTTGLLLDVTRMNQVHVDAESGTATIGAGARLIDVYASLARDGLALPAGSCPTVGITGLTLGGGIGVLGRKFGLTCDNLRSARLVLASGEPLTCDQQMHPDLFWALRGGGGGNFGVVTSLTFEAHAVPQLTICTLSWPWENAAAVVDAWQRWGPQAPDELWSNCLLLGTTPASGDPLVRVNGIYVGSAASLSPLLQQLSEQVGSAPASSIVASDSLLDAMLVEAGCYGVSVAACHLPGQSPQGQLKRDTSQARSDYVASLLPRPAIDVLVNAIGRRQASGMPGGGIGMDAWGGAIARVAADATAFVHRAALFSIQYTASWNPTDPAALRTGNVSWLRNTWQAMRPYVNGEAYQNYIDPDLADWQQAYYGANLPRLRQVKAIYDPTNLFRFAQSIPASAAG